MIYNLLFTLLIIDAIVLIGAVLLQSGKGGGLAANFGGQSSSDAFIGVRQAGTLLTKASWWCGGIFMVLAFTLQIMSTHARAPRSVLEKSLATPSGPTTAPATSTGALPLEPQTPARSPATTAPPSAAPTKDPSAKR